MDLNDPNNTARPLINRAIQGVYAPGSVFKPITAIAGIESGKISKGRDYITCRGRHNIGDGILSVFFTETTGDLMEDWIWQGLWVLLATFIFMNLELIQA